MTVAEDVAVVTGQLGRAPREPWRTVARCAFDRPSVIASPSVLADGTPFPTLYWLTCPWLSRAASHAESSGATARWTESVARDRDATSTLASADETLRRRRLAESGGVDPCAGVGIAGQRDPLVVKCVHAHVALSLVGIDDPIGAEVIAVAQDHCPDDECGRFTGGAP